MDAKRKEKWMQLNNFKDQGQNRENGIKSSHLLDFH